MELVIKPRYCLSIRLVHYIKVESLQACVLTTTKYFGLSSMFPYILSIQAVKRSDKTGCEQRFVEPFTTYLCNKYQNPISITLVLKSEYDQEMP